MRSTHAPYRRESAWVSSRPVLTILRARARLLLFVSIGALALMAALKCALPKKYEAHMELLLSSERDALDASPSAVRASYLHELLVNSEIELLRSTTVLTKVVIKVGLERREFGEDNLVGETTPLTLEKAVRRLRRDLHITPVGKSDVVQVAYSAYTPELATEVLRSLAGIYPDRRIEIHSQPSTYAFLRRQSLAWRGALMKAENDLIRCRQTNSAFILPEERAAFSRRALEARTASDQADAELAQCQQKLLREQQELDQYSPRQIAHSGTGHTPRILRAEYQGTAISQADLSALQRDLLASRAQLSGLQARRDRLKQVADRYQREMFQLAGASVEHDALLRMVKETSDHYLLYSRKQEETRIAEALALGHIANVSLVDGPTQPVEPANPFTPLDMLLALLCSLACGLVVVLLVELLKPRELSTYAAVRSMTIDLVTHDRLLKIGVPHDTRF